MRRDASAWLIRTYSATAREIADQLLQGGLTRQLISQPMLDGVQPLGAAVHNAQCSQQLLGRQCVKAQSTQPIQGSVKRVK